MFTFHFWKFDIGTSVFLGIKGYIYYRLALCGSNMIYDFIKNIPPDQIVKNFLLEVHCIFPHERKGAEIIFKMSRLLTPDVVWWRSRSLHNTGSIKMKPDAINITLKKWRLFKLLSVGLICPFSEWAGHYHESALLSNRITHLDKVNREWGERIISIFISI